MMFKTSSGDTLLVLTKILLLLPFKKFHDITIRALLKKPNPLWFITIGGKLPGLYDKQGNIKQGMNSVERAGYEVVSGVALIPSSFFTAAQSFSPQVWNAISILLKEAR